MKITLNEKEYDLSLSMGSCIALEEKLGNINPLQLISDWDENNLPTFKQLGLFLWAMLRDNHKLSVDESFDLLLCYLKAGNRLFDAMKLAIDVFSECGYIGSGEESYEKN